MDGGLPYDGTPPSESTPSPSREPSALDRPLSDHPLDPPVPEHVKSLMGRMSRGKVYLLEESTGIIPADGENRLRGDPACHVCFSCILLRQKNSGLRHWLRCWMSKTLLHGSVRPLQHDEIKS